MVDIANWKRDSTNSGHAEHAKDVVAKSVDRQDYNTNHLFRVLSVIRFRKCSVAKNMLSMEWVEKIST